MYWRNKTKPLLLSLVDITKEGCGVGNGGPVGATAWFRVGVDTGVLRCAAEARPPTPTLQPQPALACRPATASSAGLQGAVLKLGVWTSKRRDQRATRGISAWSGRCATITRIIWRYSLTSCYSCTKLAIPSSHIHARIFISY
ncbi:hypothetical protein ACJJTC_010729 [Scirpophaga incertulas]